MKLRIKGTLDTDWMIRPAMAAMISVLPHFLKKPPELSADVRDRAAELSAAVRALPVEPVSAPFTHGGRGRDISASLGEENFMNRSGASSFWSIFSSNAWPCSAWQETALPFSKVMENLSLPSYSYCITGISKPADYME